MNTGLTEAMDASVGGSAKICLFVTPQPLMSVTIVLLKHALSINSI